MDVADRLRMLFLISLNVYRIGVISEESGEFVGCADSESVRHIGLDFGVYALNHLTVEEVNQQLLGWYSLDVLLSL